MRNYYGWPDIHAVIILQNWPAFSIRLSVLRSPSVAGRQSPVVDNNASSLLVITSKTATDHVHLSGYEMKLVR